MSNRTLIELNHDNCPRDEKEALRLGLALMAYMRAADVNELPYGVTRKHYRHHTEECPIDVLKEIAVRINGNPRKLACKTLRMSEK